MRKHRSFCLFETRRDLNPRLLKILQGVHGYAIMVTEEVMHMSKKKTGKRSKKPVWDMPPLTRKDRLVYKIVGWPLLCLFPCGLLITSLWTYLGCRPLKNDPQVLFFSGGPATLSFLWAGGVSVVGMIVLLACHFKKPLWGEKDFPYGREYYPDVYPLFLKEGPAEKVSREKRWRWVIGGIFALLMLPYLLSFPLPSEPYMQFECVRSDGTLYRYDGWKNLLYTCQAEKVTAVQFRLDRRTGGYRSAGFSYGDYIEIQLDTAETVFGFSEKVSLTSLQNALELRGQYPEELISSVLSVKLDWVQHDWRDVPQAQNILAELFENAEQDYVDRFGTKEE